MAIRPEPGLVISYDLWHSEFAQGQEEGLKDRPCVILSAVVQAERSERVQLLPITHSPPAAPNLALEIPSAIRRHLRLDDERCWVVLSETNEFRWPGPDLGHSAPGQDEDRRGAHHFSQALHERASPHLPGTPVLCSNYKPRVVCLPYARPRSSQWRRPRYLSPAETRP